jgi:hypothetical protein
MRTQSTTKSRIFTLTDISEKEGLVLRTLLNLNSKGIKESLECDPACWDGDMKIDEAVSIGEELCTKIMEMVDNDN